MKNITRSSVVPFGPAPSAAAISMAVASFGIAINALFFLFTLPVSAEIYKYTEPGGHVRYTDDLNMVPETQREKADAYTELQSPSPAAPDEISDPPPGEPAGKTPPTEAELAKVSRQLMESRKALDIERNRLIEDQKSLESTAGVTSSKAEAGRHHKRLGQFRQDALEYEKKRQAFEKNLARYNAEIEALNQRRPEMKGPAETE